MEEKHKLLKTIVEGLESSAAVLADMAPSETDDQWPLAAITGLLAGYWRKGKNLYERTHKI